MNTMNLHLRFRRRLPALLSLPLIRAIHETLLVGAAEGTGRVRCTARAAAAQAGRVGRVQEKKRGTAFNDNQEEKEGTGGERSGVYWVVEGPKHVKHGILPVIKSPR